MKLSHAKYASTKGAKFPDIQKLFVVWIISRQMEIHGKMMLLIESTNQMSNRYSLLARILIYRPL